MARLRRMVLAETLIQADDFAAAEPVCAAAVNRALDAGDLRSLPELLTEMALLDLRAGRTGDAAAHLREALRLALRTGPVIWGPLDVCGYLCAATGRPAEAVTMWAAFAALITHEDFPGRARNREEPLHAARQALGPRSDAGGRAARRGDELGRRHRVCPAAHRGHRLAAARGARAGRAQRARERELVRLVAQGHTNA